MQNKDTDHDIIDDYDYLGNSASSMDCTGLIPSLPLSENELESYEQVYHFEPPKIKVNPTAAKNSMTQKTD